MGDYRVEKATRFHSPSFRPIANLLTQRRPVTFGNSAFKKTAPTPVFGKLAFCKLAAFSVVEVDPKVMALLPSIIGGVIERNPELLETHGATTPEELVSKIAKDPNAVSEVLKSHAQATNNSTYAELANRLAQSTSAGKTQQATYNAGGGAGLGVGVAADFLPPGKLQSAAQLASLVGGLAPGAAGFVNPYNQGADPEVSNLVGQIQSEEGIAQARAIAADPNSTPVERAQAQTQIGDLSSQLQELKSTYAIPQREAALSPGDNAVQGALSAGDYLDKATTAAVSPGMAKAMPLVNAVLRQSQIDGDATKLDYARDTATNALNAGSNYARARAMTQAVANALAKAGPGGLSLLRKAPIAMRAGAANPLGLLLQGAASLTEGGMSYNSPEELNKIDNERIRQLADRWSGKTSPMDHVLGNVIGGGINGALSPFSDDRRAFRASLVNALAGGGETDQQEVQQYAQQEAFGKSRNKFQTYLAKNAPWLSNSQTLEMANEAAARENEHQFSKSPKPMVAQVPTSEGNIDAYLLKQDLTDRGIPAGQQANVQSLFRMAPVSTIKAYGNGPEEFLSAIPQENLQINPSFGVGSTPFPQQEYSDETNDYLRQQRQEAEANKQATSEAQRAQTAQSTEDLRQSEAQRLAGAVQDQQMARLHKEVEHRGAIDNLRATQLANATWRQKANERWADPSNPSVAALPLATPAPEVPVVPPAVKTPALATKPAVPVVPPPAPTIKSASLGAFIPHWR